MGILTCITTISSFWLSASRILYGAAKQHQMTGRLAVLNKNGQPKLANLIVGIFAMYFTIFAPEAWVNYMYTIYGLAAGDGVMRYLEERGVGFDTGFAKVPLVCQSCLFDLTVGDAHVRPDAAMAYAACRNAEQGNYRDGNYGAGTGATVGKIRGMERCMKSGIGSYAVQLGALKVGALVAVNALGDIYDWRNGQKVAGLLAEDGRTFADGETEALGRLAVQENKFVGNTTLGVVLTNARFDKSRLCKIAGMAQDGYARAIRPVHTTADGDSIYAVSLGDVPADQDAVGALGARVMAQAILRAVKAAVPAYGFPAASAL